VGAHRRRRPPPRSGRGVVWTGLFLLLAVVATVVSRNLWPDLVEELLGTVRVSTPPGLVLWEAECPDAGLISVDSGGRVLVVPQRGGAVLLLDRGSPEKLGLPLPGTVLAVSVKGPPAGALAEEGPPPAVWRVVMAAPAGGADTFLSERLFWHDIASSGAEVPPAEGSLVTQDEAVTAACGEVDGAEVAAGLYEPGLSGDPRGSVIAVGAAGQRLWSRVLGDQPVHRVAGRERSGFVAAATPERVFFLDTRGNLLWSKSFKEGVTDVALQSHGGPAVASGELLASYDRRGNLLWRKRFESPVRFVASAGGFIAAAWGREVLVFDEEGVERWSVSAEARPTAVALDPTGKVAAILLDSGRLLVTQAPGTSAVGGEDLLETSAGSGRQAPGPEEPPHSVPPPVTEGVGKKT